jgi:hypothetical protein
MCFVIDPQFWCIKSLSWIALLFCFRIDTTGHLNIFVNRNVYVSYKIVIVNGNQYDLVHRPYI